MESILKILNKHIVSMLECKDQGIVKDFYITKNLTKIKYLLIENTSKLNKLIKPSKIYNYSNEIITIKNEDSLLEITNNTEGSGPNLPINSLVIMSNGKILGTIKDILIDEKFNIIDIILDNDKKLDISKVIKFNKEHTFLREENEILKLSKKEKTKNTYYNKELIVKNNISPSSILCNYEYLLKKKLRFDLPFNDGTILKRGSIVTENIISKALRENKIKKLLICCLGNICYF